MTIDYFVWLAQAKQTDLQKPESATVHYHVLASQEDKTKKKAKWAKTNLQRRLEEPSLELWQYIHDPSIDLAILPAYSFSLRFTFTLAQPYLSKDDNDFYIIDNPIVRDKVFRLPMVRPSSWKGNLRAALRKLQGSKEEDASIQRLFGKVNKVEDEVQSGRLFFYPPFFTQTSLEIINPHDRARRVGKNPILFECVPQESDGNFTLLYVPFDRIATDDQETHRQVAEDLVAVANGVNAMMITYGFGAKTSSGFGLTNDEVEDGSLAIRASELSILGAQEGTLPVSQSGLPRYLTALGQLKPEYLNPDGTFRERSEAELQKLKKSARQEYEKARKWWEREGRLLDDRKEPQPKVPASPEPPKAEWPSLPFDSLSGLVNLANQVADRLQQDGE